MTLSPRGGVVGHMACARNSFHAHVCVAKLKFLSSHGFPRSWVRVRHPYERDLGRTAWPDKRRALAVPWCLVFSCFAALMYFAFVVETAVAAEAVVVAVAAPAFVPAVW